MRGVHCVQKGTVSVATGGLPPVHFTQPNTVVMKSPKNKTNGKPTRTRVHHKPATASDILGTPDYKKNPEFAFRAFAMHSAVHMT